MWFFKVNIRKYMILDSKKVRKTFYIGAKVISYLKKASTGTVCYIKLAVAPL